MEQNKKKIDKNNKKEINKETLLIEAKALADLNSKLRTKKQRLAIRLA